MTPETFQSYRLDDLWLALQGWDDSMMFQKFLHGQSTAILGHILAKGFNMNGNVMSSIHESFGLFNKEPSTELTPEKITELIQRHNEKMKLKREKKNNNG